MQPMANVENFFGGAMALRPNEGHGLLILEVSRSHTDAPQSVGLLWTSDQVVAETSTCQHTTLTADKHPYPRWDSNPRIFIFIVTNHRKKRVALCQLLDKTTVQDGYELNVSMWVHTEIRRCQRLQGQETTHA